MKTKLLSVDYLGFTAMDRRFSSAMLPWVLLEIRRRGTKEKLCLGVEKGTLQAFDVNFELQFTHRLQNIIRFTQVQSNPTEFLYLLRDSRDHLLYCYLFQATTVEEVTELFGHMKELTPQSGSLQSLNKNANSGSESSISSKTSGSTKAMTPSSAMPGAPLQRQTSVATNKGFQLNPVEPLVVPTDGQTRKIGTSNMATSQSYTTGLNRSSSSIAGDTATGPAPLARSLSNAANLTSLCVDISPSNSHFFEVLYVGKIKVSHKKVPETLIDDALGKFRQYETDKMKSAQMRRNSLLSTQADSISSDRDSLESLISQQNIKRVEFASLPTANKKETAPVESSKDVEIRKNQDGLMSPSLTPLETSKHFFSEDDAETDSKDIEKEFDELSAVRVQKVENNKAPNQKSIVLNKKSFPVALEPNVLILNFPQNEASHNLATLDEDEFESSSLQETTLENETKDSTNKILNEQSLIDFKETVDINKIENKMDKNTDIFNIHDVKNSVQTAVGSIIGNENKSASFSEMSDLFDSNSKDESLNNSLRNKILPENKSFTRDRSASIGTLNLNKTPIAQLIGDQNRTMLFQVGRSDLRLISPDRKQVLLHKQLRDVASCVQGVSNKEHFGFICRESDVECFVGYVFKCQSDGVSSDVVGAITQAFVAHTELVKQGKEKSPILSCDHCPMVWYHKLCQDLEGINERRVHTTILRRLDQLTEEEQVQITTKYLGGTEDLYEVGEHNAFLMMLLRAHCEAKQQRHIHDTAENRSEFLNQYLGGSTIFMKAKRSLSSSFDHLLKRKPSKDDFNPAIKDILKKENSPINHSSTPTRDSTQDLHLDLNANGKSRSRTIQNSENSLSANGNSDSSSNLHEHSPSPQLKSPMLDIFMKLGNSPSTKSHSMSEHATKKQSDNSESDDSATDRLNKQGSWRQAIFNRVVDITAEGNDNVAVTTTGELLRRPASFSNLNQIQQKKRSKEELRELWKKGINQAILLIRMEKENARLRARQEVSAVKRIKLEYEDIGGCANENSKVWDTLTSSRESRISTKVDSQKLLQAIKHGVPRAKRGEVWYFLAEQFCLRQPPPDVKAFPNYSVPYESLLKQLTSHQHAILIDLGRTFPNHTYFSSPLGPGQLALFNLLKAYSLLDPEVGYCQGLSFVAGVLLLHLDEGEAFLMLRHLMFRRGLRKQYLPDMVALQIQLYQLSRLLKDHLPELYEKFDQYDVSPTLYAAPWILTIFTSQFPLGFVTRVFDLLFLESSEIIFRVAIALLDIHKDNIMVCDSFEEVMDYMKHKMPNIDKPMLDKVIKVAFTLDFGRQLHEYQVEYNVLQEEMAAIAPKMESLNKLEKQNKQLHDQNRQLLEQLEVSASKLSGFQVTQSRLENQVKSLEQTVASLARFIGTTHDKKKDNDLPNDIKKICQQVQQSDRKTLGALGQKLGQSFSSKFASTDFTNINGTIAISEESNIDSDDKNVVDKNKKPNILKTGLSTPNLFNRDSNKVVPQPKPEPTMDQLVLEKKRQYLSMKKSHSCNAGLMANLNKLDQANKPEPPVGMMKLPSNLKGVPLKVLDENPEYNEKVEKTVDNINFDTLKSSIISEATILSNNMINNLGEQKKTSKFFANSHEQIRQEKLQAEQLKKDFDDNLRKLDARLSPQTSFKDFGNNLKSPTSPTSQSMTNDIKLSLSNKNLSGDSGLGTPMSPPNDKLTNNNTFAIVHVKNENDIGNHPLVGCDLDIKFDVQTTKLKSIRPTRIGLGSRNSSIDGGDSRN